MANIFKTVKSKKQPTNVFDLSHEVKMPGRFGYLQPFFIEDVIPGDSFRAGTEILLRFAPMLAPIMHRVNVYTHFFFVPNRLLWSDWENFITGGENGQSNLVPPRLALHPTYLFSQNALSTYFGINAHYTEQSEVNAQTSTSHLVVDALPFLAYNKIYNDYYRDQNIEEPLPETWEEFKDIVGELTPGSNISPVIKAPTWSNQPSEWSKDNFGDLIRLRVRAWEKDYFSSALPWTQRGGDVYLPLGDEAPVKDIVVNGKAGGPGPSVQNWSITGQFQGGPDVTPDGVNIKAFPIGGETSPRAYLSSNENGIDTRFVVDPLQVKAFGTGTADLSQATAVTINDLRRANALQRWLEKNARGGARYIEQILSHFGVRSSDARLQRAEYLGGGKSPVTISEVVQQSGTFSDESAYHEDVQPLGQLGGHGISASVQHSFTKRKFEEHGWIIGLLSVRPKAGYMQGIPRKFLRVDKFDYAWPSFANLGEQPIKNCEIFADTKEEWTEDNQQHGTFGYTPRYAEYKFEQDRAVGAFRSNGLSFWHLARKFSNPPALNSQFIGVTPDSASRIFTVQGKDGQGYYTEQFYCQIYNNVRAIRRLPKYGTPTL